MLIIFEGLIRCGTCGNSDVCDYRVVGNNNPLEMDESWFYTI